MCYYTPESDSETFFLIKNHSVGNMSLKFRKTSQNDDIGSKCTIELDINLKYEFCIKFSKLIINTCIVNYELCLGV